jgi:hypothetical protein
MGRQLDESIPEYGVKLKQLDELMSEYGMDRVPAHLVHTDEGDYVWATPAGRMKVMLMRFALEDFDWPQLKEAAEIQLRTIGKVKVRHARP